MLVVVSQEDIDEGRRGTPYRCPIALATTRTLRKNTRVTESGIDYVGLSHVRYNFSKSTREKLNRYDRTGKMKPFRFRIQLQKLWSWTD